MRSITFRVEGDLRRSLWPGLSVRALTSNVVRMLRVQAESGVESRIFASGCDLYLLQRVRFAFSRAVATRLIRRKTAGTPDRRRETAFMVSVRSRSNPSGKVLAPGAVEVAHVNGGRVAEPR